MTSDHVRVGVPATDQIRPSEDGRSVAAPAIKLRGVSKRYGSEVALAPIDLDIGEGEFFCLLGPSGSGKSTTLNLIGGFVTASSGEIWIRGEVVNQLPPYKRPVNTVFQSYALFPHMTVRENVSFGLKMAKTAREESRERTKEALSLVGLEQYAGRFPAELSGGQQQRVAVARALVNRPHVLLLDEPLGSLDLQLRQRLQFELAQIHKEIGTTFVYVTHDQNEAMSLADRIAIMKGGEIQQVGTPREIYFQPASRFVADFVGESNLLEVVAGMEEGFVALRNGVEVPCACAQRSGDVVPGCIMVRPESLRVELASEHQQRGSLRGRLADIDFLGAVTRVVVVCGDLQEPLVASLSRHDQAVLDHLQEGDDVSVRWEPQDATLLPRHE